MLLPVLSLQGLSFPRTYWAVLGLMEYTPVFVASAASLNTQRAFWSRNRGDNVAKL